MKKNLKNKMSVPTGRKPATQYSPKGTIEEQEMHDQNFAKWCVSKWKPLLENKYAPKFTSLHSRNTTAILLENQDRCFNEAANTSSIWGTNTQYGGAIAQGDTYAKGDNRMPKVLLPMIRRAFPELIANEVVGVQPMTGPVSLAFAIRYRYEKGTLHEARSAGTITNPTQAGYNYGVDTYRQGVYNNTGDAPDGTYPPETTDMRQMDATVAVTGTTGVVKPAEMGYNYMDNTYTGRKNAQFNRTVNPATGGPWTDQEIVHSYFLTGGNLPQGSTSNFLSFEQVLAIAVNPVDPADPNGAINKQAAENIISSTSLAGGAFTFSDQDLGTAALLGDYEATGRIPKTKFTFEKKAVEAGTRRIGTSWTLELEQDIKNMNGIEIETEVTSMMSYELQAEIDREMIVRMLYAALSANEYSYWDGTKADARWMAERDRAFYQFLIQQSNRMTTRNRRGPANFIIATPDVCSLLETLPQFTMMQVDGNVNTNNVGIAKVGTIGGRFTVYRDTRTPVQNNAWINTPEQAPYTVGGVKRTTGIPDFCLLGYKGAEYWDAGILFCPYIPIMLQKVVDPVSFEPNVGLLTRYGVVDNLFGANLYYHVILIDTLGNTLPTAGAPANTFPIVETKVSVLSDTVQRGGYPTEIVNTEANPVLTKDVT